VTVPDWAERENERHVLRVVGYIREVSSSSEPAFSQQEKIRRWVGENGHRLVAQCQDVRTPGHAVGREGLQSIMGIISAGQVDAVVVPSLATFATDKVTQEVIMWELRSSGVTLLSTEPHDVAELADSPADGMRALIRHVLDKQERFESILSLPLTEPEQPSVVRIDDTRDVVVELIPPESAKPATASLVRPAP
jgi:DNA invertase Pin-like site-specific DNA recombinase